MPKNPISPISVKPPYTTFNGAWHLVYYIPSRNRTEAFSKSLIDFKKNVPAVVKKWVTEAVKQLKTLNLEVDYVVRALGSQETEASGGKSLDILGAEFAKTLKAKYMPEIIKKSKLTKPMHEIGARHLRYSTLEAAYYCNEECGIEDGKSFLIIDDITTSGATITTIRDTIKEAYPDAKVYFLTLGRTGWKDEWGEYNTTLNSTFDSTFLN